MAEYISGPSMMGPHATVLSTLPLFHGFGMATLNRTLCNASHLALLNADRPVTATIISQALDATGARCLYTVPFVLKFLAEMDGGVEKLAALDLVLAGGAATPQALGDLLTSHGVRLWTVYGQTETGGLMQPVGASVGQWDWYTPMPHTEGHLEFEKL